METAAKSKKKKKNNKKSIGSKKITNFKLYCVKNNITQVKLRELTELSIGCIHATWHDGHASNSTIKLISLVLKMTEKSIRELITTFVVSDRLDESKDLIEPEQEVNLNQTPDAAELESAD